MPFVERKKKSENKSLGVLMRRGGGAGLRVEVSRLQKVLARMVSANSKTLSSLGGNIGNERQSGGGWGEGGGGGGVMLSEHTTMSVSRRARICLDHLAHI